VTDWQPDGLALSQSEPAFADAVAACAVIWQRLRGVDLRALWTQASVDTAVTLPLHFTRQYALAQLWRSWGIAPQALLGVGVGELVAACLAEVLSLEDALSVIAVAETPALSDVEGTVNGSLSAHLRSRSFQEPTLPIVSAKTGTWLTHEQAATPDYYADLLTHSNGTSAIETITQTAQYLLLTLGQAVDDVAAQYPSLGDGDAQAHLLQTVGALWQAGVDVNWHGFYAAEERRRVVLPTYPFQRQRYWIEPDGTPALAESAATLVKEPELTDWFYAPTWRSETAVSPLSAHDLTANDHWLILADALGVAQQMEAWLQQAGQTVTLVNAGSDFSEVANRFTINPLNPAHYQSLLAAIPAPQRILHLWQLTSQMVPSNVDAFEQNIGLSYYSLLFLAQALGQEPVQIDVVANHVHQVMESDPISPEKAILLGACRVIPQEYLHLSCRLLDVVLPQPTERWITQLLGVLQTAPSTLLSAGVSTPSFALRGTQRWLPEYAPAPIAAEATTIRPLRTQGVYLIVGGLSDIGLELAKQVAKSVQARLVLVDDNDATDVADRLRVLGAADVLVVRGDVAQQGVLETAVSQAIATFGALHGVIHAPSIQNDRAFCPVQDVTVANGHWHFGAKLHSLYALENAIVDQSLDFCLVSSALSVVLGGVGFATFTATAAGLDAFVHSRNQNSTFPWLAVNWDVWQFAEDLAELTAVGGTLAQLALSPDEGGEVMRRLVTAVPYTQTIISTGDLKVRQLAAQEKTLAQREAANGQAFYDRPDLWTEYIAPQNEMEEKVVQLWQQLLGINQIGINDNFFDLGG
ncbi:MAG: SDR family NAD(P)-dependent oxidoreductase, partial [Aestuariibacter sp.]|nr:SDR family NAD(P)-dependent oxidoreductase [Aestuariibacter sp.]